MKKSNFVRSEICLSELHVHMLSNAWYPYHYFKLSFGKQDKITSELESLNVVFSRASKVPAIDELKQAIDLCELSPQTLRYVPYRLIRPFFSNETRGLSDGKVNKAVKECADLKFDISCPFYKFNHDETSLILHPKWMQYFALNISIVESWANWHLLGYLQKNNRTHLIYMIK